MLDFGSLRLGFAFSLGTATFFAPCAFPLLPGYVAFYLGRDDDAFARSATGRAPVLERLRSALVVGLLTSLGFFLVYTVLAGVVVALGSRVLGNVSVLELVAGTVLVVLGIAMATGQFRPGRLHTPLPERRRTPAGFVAFGIVYAAAAAGCTAPFFVAIVSLGLTSGPVAAIALLAAYAGGMSVLMVGVTLLLAFGRDTLLRKLTARTDRIVRIAGVVLVVTGLLQIYFFLFLFDGLQTLGVA